MQTVPEHGDFPFEGRDRELASLVRSAEEALGSRGQVTLIAGEAGIGKSRLLAEFTTRLPLENTLVVSGLCREVEGAPAYWPWSQVLRQLSQSAREVETDRLSGFMEHDPGRGDSINGQGSSAAFALHSEIAEYIRGCSQDTPLVLILEDLHWADTSSLRALEFLVPELRNDPVLLLLTLREPERSSRELRNTIADLARQPNSSRIDLQPFGLENVRRLIAGHAPAAVGEAQSTLELTGGNALFVTEAVRLLASGDTGGSGRVSAPADGLLPVAASLVIERRIDSLPAATIDLLEYASVYGREINTGHLAELTGLSAAETLERMEPAIERGMLVRSPAQLTDLRFSHELVRQSILSRLPIARSAELNLEVARLFERVHPRSSAEQAGTIAYHYGQARALAGDRPLFEYSLLAGKHEVANFAYREARQHLETAIEILVPGSLEEISSEGGLHPGEQSPRPFEHFPVIAEVAQTLAALARAYSGTNRDALALPCIKAAYDRFLALGETGEALRVAMFPLGVGSAASAELYQTALDIAEPGTREHTNVLSKIGTDIAGVPLHDYEQGLEYLSAAVDAATALGDRNLMSWTLGRLAMVHKWYDNWPEATRTGSRAVELATRGHDYESTVHACRWTTVSHASNWELGRARHFAELGQSAAAKSKNEIRVAQAGIGYILVLAHEGRLAEAISVFDDGRFTNRNWVIDELLEISLRLQHQPDPGSLDPVRKLDYGQFMKAHYGAFLARFAMEFDANPFGWERVEELLNSPTLAVGLPFHRIAIDVGMAMFAIGTSDEQVARETYGRLLRYAGSIPTDGWSSSVSIDRILGRLSGSLAERQKERRHYEDALALLRPNGYRTELAWTCHNYAAMLLESGQKAAAAALIAEGLEISKDCELRLLENRFTALSAGSDLDLSGTDRYGLTDRELEVLRQIADGKKNREISEALFISENTVATHVKNILSKTGSSSRVQAARKLDSVSRV